MPAISIRNLSKTYASGQTALSDVNLDIASGEIFALLGPNGAGKTTLISIVCGIVRASAGHVEVDGQDIRRAYRACRARIGLVPQELSTDAFESVWSTVRLSRGLFGKPARPDYLEQILRELSLWDKRDAQIMSLSGGMKRRVLIAKALAHEPDILFLDEPTAGVDVTLRRDMWALVRGLRARGVTIILTTHYIEEAEEMADRVGVIVGGRIVVVEEKATLMEKLGQRTLTVTLQAPLHTLPTGLAAFSPTLMRDGHELEYRFEASDSDAGIPKFLAQLTALGIDYRDLRTAESSLEDIFVGLLEQPS